MTKSLLVRAAFGLRELARASMELQGHLRAFVGRAPEPLEEGGDGGDGFSFHKKRKTAAGTLTPPPQTIAKGYDYFKVARSTIWMLSTP